jgi:hypothetical protein
MSIINEQAFFIGYADNVVCPSAQGSLGRIVVDVLCNCIRQTSRWIPVAVQYVHKGITRFLARQTGPNDLDIKAEVNINENCRGLLQ